MNKNLTVSKSYVIEVSAEQVFAEYNKLEEYVSIYVPSTIYNKPIDNTSIVNKIAKVMSEIFGGTTAYKAQGGYVADSGEYISEQVTIVKSNAEKITGAMAQKVIELAKEIKETMQQECVSVEYNGKLMFI